MITLTYEVAGTQTADDGAIAVLEFEPSRAVEPVRSTPITGVARAVTVIQKTTTEIERRVTIAQDAITEEDLPEWERLFVSQAFSNSNFELDATKVPGIGKILQCNLEAQPFTPTRLGLNHYTVVLNALVISST